MDVSNADQLAADIQAQQGDGTADLFCNFYLPPQVAYVRRGVWWQDWFPILSLVATLPTLYLFARSRWHFDVVVYTMGLLVATLYHYLQVKPPGGLATATWMGLPGAGWRVVDIIFADVMLARSSTHLLGINHPWIALLPNLGLPTFLVTLLLTSPTHAGLRVFTTATTVCTLLTIALQLIIDARAIVHHAVTRYNRPLVIRTLIFCALGFTCFAIPAYNPSSYWFWHSAWHICMGFAYFEVYSALCSPAPLEAGTSKGYSSLLYSSRLDTSTGNARSLSKHMNGEHPLLKEEQHHAAHAADANADVADVGTGKQNGEGKGVSAGTKSGSGRGRRKSSSGGDADGGGAQLTPSGAKSKKGGARSPGRPRRRKSEGGGVAAGEEAAGKGEQQKLGNAVSTPTPKEGSGPRAGGEDEFGMVDAPDSIAKRVHARRRRSGVA